MSLHSVRSSHRTPQTVNEKAPPSQKCQKAVGVVAASSSLIGVVSVIAVAILFIAAPMVMPILAFKAVLIIGGALALFGSVMTITLIAMGARRLALQKRTESRSEERRQLIAQKKDLQGKLQKAHVEKQLSDSSIQALQEQSLNLEKKYQKEQEALESLVKVKCRMLNRRLQNTDGSKEVMSRILELEKKIQEMEEAENEYVEKMEELIQRNRELQEKLDQKTPFSSPQKSPQIEVLGHPQTPMPKVKSPNDIITNQRPRRSLLDKI